MLPDIKKLRGQMFVVLALIFGDIIMHTYLYPPRQKWLKSVRGVMAAR
jgi:hypothetical protein